MTGWGGCPDHERRIMKHEFTNTEADDWSQATVVVRAYLRSVPMNDHPRELFLAERIIMSAKNRWRKEPDRQPLQVAMEETILEMTTLTREILREPLGQGASPGCQGIAASGLKSPGEWMSGGQDPDFVATLRSSRRWVRPAVDRLEMGARPLDLNAIGAGAATIWESMDRHPAFRRMTGVLLLGLLAIGLWFLLL